jgi:adenosylcobinamide-GDP ribazoletransferase
VQKLFTAVKYLTIWRNFTAIQASPAALGASMIYFPVIGLALGLFLALINYLLAPYLAPEILSMILITALVVLTGANHLTALKNSFAAGSVEK